ncbi:PTS lactose/cellobiose transporter subunit IIA [Vagococcus coleopterorum]|uniref:PTS system lactose-specific EIIA component n=1 Tax=Vagococcus coleopterorum TaxID=2714946 RepID=A0A6G8APA5_9ENTE|nr:PTS lactose/cellobiose transporter subunit IIA [Vagococcus coleopterorum]QIL46753.1 PTS lactose/cellobiose transporter subunit IIA [Vagococcus coleopterorum]
MDQQMMAFQIIAKAGDAFSKQMEALTEAKKGEFERATELVREGKDDLTAAHHVQTEILTAEAQGVEMQITPIVVHAQDHLTKAIIGDFFVKELIGMQKQINELKK